MLWWLVVIMIGAAFVAGLFFGCVVALIIIIINLESINDDGLLWRKLRAAPRWEPMPDRERDYE